MTARDPATGRFTKREPVPTVVVKIDGNLDEDAIAELRRQIREAGHRVPFAATCTDPSPARVEVVRAPARRGRRRWLLPLAFAVAITWLIVAIAIAQNATNR